jgi:hypothetical protein
MQDSVVDITTVMKEKAAREQRWLPTPFSTEVANMLELYLRLPTVPAEACHGGDFVLKVFL